MRQCYVYHVRSIVNVFSCMPNCHSLHINVKVSATPSCYLCFLFSLCIAKKVFWIMGACQFCGGHSVNEINIAKKGLEPKSNKQFSFFPS